MTASAEQPLVARVAVEVGLPHLDRPFDYLVPDELAAQVAPGVRVRVRFAGKLIDGFVVGLGGTSDVGAKLRPIERVISPEVVLTDPIARLCRAVADHYAGTFADVVRMAVPGRHAATERATAPEHPQPELSAPPVVLPGYPGGAAFLDAVEQGRPLRANWLPTAVHGIPGDWARGLVEAAAATLRAGRGALLLVPDASALTALAERCAEAFGPGSFVELSAEAGPAARYRAFLAVARGGVRLVLGTRNAAYAPVADLGLIALWDEGNDSYAEPRAPYPHTREVVALRAAQERTALLVAGFARTAETQSLVDRGWLASLAGSPGDNRRRGPMVRIAADTDRAQENDPAAKAARVPHDVFAAIRRGLASGPVLLQVPRSGYVAAASCQTCRAPARCPVCSGRLHGERVDGGLQLVCGACGPLPRPWRCGSCGGRTVRAPRVGVRRTAEELGKAFPQTRVVESWAGHLVDEVGDEPALVLATPGAEPFATAGYAVAVLLDSWLLLNRPDLRAAEEALRRWLGVAALVRPAAEGGTVVAVGEPDARALQALVRLDPVGFAERELAERRATGFPPAAKMATVDGARPTVDAYAAALVAGGAECFGPAPLGAETWRLTARVALDGTPRLLAALRDEAGRRSAAKDPTARVRIDPQQLS